jgi:long-chain acyl-CoA synthetase
MVITERFAAAVEKFSDRTAIWDPERSWNYSYLNALARQGASALLTLNPSDNVGLLLPTIKEFALTYLSVLHAGKVPVPINFLLQPAELKFILQDAGIDTVITSTRFRDLVGFSVPNVVYLEELDWTAGAMLEPPPPPETKPDDIATILYTSGTTGKPKGVLLSHRNLLSNVDSCIEATGIGQDDVSLGVLPLFHSFGITVTVLLPLLEGCESIFLPQFAPDKVLDLLEGRKCTVFAALPSMYRLLTRTQVKRKADLSKMRWFIAGGEPLPAMVSEGFQKVFGTDLREGYGMTETAPVISINLSDEVRPRSCGTALPDVEVRIADDGEIQVKGPNVMLGYYNRPDETKAAFTEDGWLRTGDLGYMDDDGYIFINGRAKDLIISAGENIFPGEIEEILAEHPKVLAAAVIGAPDEKRGEVPVGYVQPHEGVEVEPSELQDFLKDRLAPFKIPKEIHVRQLPIGPTGKVVKRLLKTN